MKVAIVIPAYNEERRIGNKLDSYSKYLEEFRKKEKMDYKILIAVNNTKDRTVEIIKSYKRKNKRIDYIDLPDGGKGYAIIEGFKLMVKEDFDLIGFVDSDKSTSPEAYCDLIKNIKGDYGILASRYVPHAIVKTKQSFERIVVSRLGNILIRTLFAFNYRDTQCGAKLFKKEAIEKVLPNLTLTRWAFDIDLLYQLKKERFKVVEFPTMWEDDLDSKLNVKKATIQVFFAAIKLRLMNSPLRRITEKVLGPVGGMVWRLLR